FQPYLIEMTSKRKQPDLDSEDGEQSTNAKIAKIMIELSNYEKNKNRNLFKFKAYRKAADLIKTHPTPIKSGKQAKEMNGIGDKIAKKIDEILTTGSLKKLCEVKQDDEANSINELTKISGVGPALAKKLVNEGIKSVEELKKHPGKLNHQQKIGLKYFEDLELRIPRAEMLQLEELVLSEAKKIDPDLIATACGSFRRGASSSGDIDFLLTHQTFTEETRAREAKSKDKKKGNHLDQLITRLKNCGFITDVISHGQLKFMGICKLDSSQHHRRIDFQLIPFEQYYCGLIHFTGSDLFNIYLRGEAHKQGFILNEYSLRPLGSTGVPGEPLPVTSEEDVFDYLGIEYKGPTERSH
uniref:DNA polymerase n=2 Tax=Macrostomum lignano TaxID=282301 RepID=A0A1I8HZS6_9PLAT